MPGHHFPGHRLSNTVYVSENLELHFFPMNGYSLCVSKQDSVAPGGLRHRCFPLFVGIPCRNMNSPEKLLLGAGHGKGQWCSATPFPNFFLS